MSKLKIGGRPQIMIRKDMLKHSVDIGSKNIEISKIFNVSRNLVASFNKFHGLTDVVREPEDDNKIIQMLYEVQQFHPNSGYHHAVINLRIKRIKVEQLRFRVMLENIKNLQPIKIDVIRRRACKNRSNNAV